jgi:ribonuclease HepT-like protein
MSPPPPEDARVLLLRAEVERDWTMVRAHLDRARSVDAAAGAPQAALVALSLDHAYQAFETMLLRIERALGLPERTGSDWHRDLLAHAATALAGLRPAVIPADAEVDWDELRRFRHFLRHAYTVDLDVEKLSRNVERLARAEAATDVHIRALLDALR